MKILEEAIDTQIIREADYGRFPTVLNETAEAVSIILGKEITGKDVAIIYAVNKLLRERKTHKRDNILDALAYIGVIDQLEDGAKL